MPAAAYMMDLTPPTWLLSFFAILGGLIGFVNIFRVRDFHIIFVMFRIGVFNLSVNLIYFGGIYWRYTQVEQDVITRTLYVRIGLLLLFVWFTIWQAMVLIWNEKNKIAEMRKNGGS